MSQVTGPGGSHIHSIKTAQEEQETIFEMTAEEFLADFWSNTLPKGSIQVTEDLAFYDCPGLTSLPGGLEVAGSLNFSDCTGLTSLPEGLKVGGRLRLKNSPGLTSLPEDLSVGRDLLILNGCTGLTSLPKGLEVGRDLKLSFCTGLTSLPKGLKVGRDLNLASCERLTSLPEGLEVGGNLVFTGCTGLTSLPEGLKVGGNLVFTGCTGLTSLSEGLEVGGDVSFVSCLGLTSLPNWITTLGVRSDGKIRGINLWNTGLSDAIIERLRGAKVSGMRFYCSMQAGVVEETFPTWQKALDFWKKVAESDLTLPQPSLEGERYEAMVKQFLERLTATAEYKNQNTRQPLACRILEIFKVMAQDNTLKERSVDLIMRGVETCDDRVIATVNDLEVLHKVYEAEKGMSPDQALRQLALGLMKLERVRQAAREHCATLTFINEVDTDLAFQVVLREPLDLPVSTQNMIFRNLAQISDERLQEIGERIRKDCTQEALEPYLQTWEPWQKHLRRESVPAYERLPVLNKGGSLECILTQDTAEQPVWVPRGGDGEIYDYQSLAKAYIETGKNPFTQERLDWNQVKRVVASLEDRPPAGG